MHFVFWTVRVLRQGRFYNQTSAAITT